MARKKNKKLMKAKILNIGIRKYHSDFRLNWKQAKRKYPRMMPHGDSDFDGTLNSKDCRPLNPAMDGKFTEWIRRKIQERRVMSKAKRAVTRIEAEKAIRKKWEGKRPWTQKQLQKAVRRRVFIKPYEKAEGVVRVLKKVVGPVKRTKRGYILPAGIKTYVSYGKEKVKGKVKQRVKAGPGRPAGVYKHISPLTGKRVPATVYYSHRKEVRRKLRSQAQQSQIREQAVMARRGVPPQITRMRQIQRIQQPQQIQEAPQQLQQVQQYPQQIPTQQLPLQRPQPYKVVTDIMTGRRMIKSIPPRERWTM